MDRGKDPKTGQFVKKGKKKQTVVTTKMASASASKDKQASGFKKDGCFICQGPHLAKNCPKRE